MIVRALVIGDVHLTRKRIHRSRELLSRIHDVIRKYDPDHTVLLGDVFDTHDIQDNDCLSAYAKFVNDSEPFTTIHHVVGNHEMNDSRTFLPDVHALNPWKGRSRFFVHDKPTTMQFDGINIGFVPYVPNGQFKEALSQLSVPPRLVFAHQEFKGCEMGSAESTEGDENPEIQVITGHIHGEQKIGNVWYPGTPCQHSFAEDEEKYIYMIEITGEGYRVSEKIDLDLPKFKTIHTSATEFPEQDFEDGNEYRIVVKDTPENLILYKKTEFYRNMHKTVKFKFTVVKEEAQREELDRHRSFRQRFEELIDQEGLQETYEAIFK